MDLLVLLGLLVFQARNAARRSSSEAEKAKNASLQAQAEVEKVRHDLRLLSNIVDFEKALGLMEDVKFLIRNSMREQIAGKISDLVRLLNKIRTPTIDMTNEDKALIQTSILALRKLESSVDRANQSTDQPINVAVFNLKVSQQIDRLQPIMTKLKDRLGR